MNHILVPIDFSNTSINALEHSILIANMLSYDIRLIHVKRKNADYNTSFNIDDFNEVLLSGIEDNFEDLIRVYGKDLNGKIDYRIREGRIYTEICNQANYGDSEIIVMGTHGVSGFEERWVGSNAFGIVSNASCPVITIRYNFPKREIKKIIMPIDVTKETRHKVPFVTKLAQTFNAEVHVIDVREDNKASTRKLLNEYVSLVVSYLKRRNVKYICDSLKDKNLTDVIIEYALLNDADIIAVTSDTNELARQFWFGPKAQQMVNHSPIPILSFS